MTTNKLCYEVRLSYNNNTQDIVIEAEELAKVMWAFATNSKVILEAGAFRGQDIISILPDYVSSMGWNRGHKPDTSDWKEIKQVLGRRLENYQSEVKKLVMVHKDILKIEGEANKLLEDKKYLLE